MKTNGSKNSLINGEEFEKAIHYHIKYSLGKKEDNVSGRDLFRAISLATRETIIDVMLKTEDRYNKKDVKRAYYLSMEFLMGRSLDNNLYNLGIYETCKQLTQRMGLDLDQAINNEIDAALGNGGLGRLAACFLDSMASLAIPGYGYGINYEFGLFKQIIDNGYQIERPDCWKRDQCPWLIERPEDACIVPLYGYVDDSKDRNGQYNPMWVDWKVIIGVPYDMPIVGYGGHTVNYLRLFSARSSERFDMQVFNTGDYLKAVEQKIYSETICKVLYPSDSLESGKELRLIQEYFLVACSLRDIVRQYLKNHKTFSQFSSKAAIQLNDTHPALSVSELMRLLVDEHHLSWDEAWEITEKTLSYTNHTLLPEALEKWPEDLFQRVLPRHLQIIYEINHRFLQQVASNWPNDNGRLERMSIIEEGEIKQIRMAHLAIVGSHSVNGVAAMHSELVKTSLVPDFYALWPDKFNNKTNGITPRRWLLKANPLLAELINKTIGDQWITKLDKLKGLERYADDRNFQKEFLEIKLANKKRLAKVIEQTARVTVDPQSLFDIQAKRMHEYKRQLLNVMHIIHFYLSIVEDNQPLKAPRTFIFAGKAAPGYHMAKLIIKLINSVGDVINNDPNIKGQIKVVFIPDYGVTLAEDIIPAADLSEQISTAGKEASGTGNMKFALNGALTMGTMDGANVEIKEEVGDDNIFIFGLFAQQIQQMQEQHSYNPWDYYYGNEHIKRVMDSITSGRFSGGDHYLFKDIFESIMHHGDEYFHLADLESYIQTQQRASEEFARPSLWGRKAILNVARMGKFSSDRTITEYAKEIWNVPAVV